jgi:chromosome partitioning protein
MIFISIVNQKGGVGKTSIAVNLSHALVNRNNKVLLVDLDIQSNATLNLIDVDEEEQTIAECFLSENYPISNVIKSTKIENLDIAPSGQRMTLVELNIYPRLARESILKKAFQGVQDYDFVIFDLPPFLSLLTVNALNCSNYALVPVSANFFSLYGIKLLNETIYKIKENLNDNLTIIGYVINAYDRRESETFTVEETLRENLGKQVFNTVIRTNTLLKQSQGERSTIYQYEGNNGKGKADFDSLAGELLERFKEV